MQCQEYLDLKVVQLVFERTVEKSLLRELFLDWIMLDSQDHTSLEDWLSGTIRGFEKDSALDFASLDGSGFYPALMEKNLRFQKQGRAALKWRHDRNGQNDRPGWEEFFFNKNVYNCEEDDSEE
ncbi:unnamed protein product [Zymoseptoria tritici ST99CH_1E4]|uniref:Uncharacterized protein n=1 Tax=Zymoseptoria tritici ST99CH_1E4 TaxID=1276532 RepID=A0A2H1H3K6_ZYMTR|nr:unnamed protein product [Zymoseptoria tritici ST99CH_1E4]